MKRRNGKMRKILLTVCCALILVAVSVGATLAYLTDNEAVVNTFTVGQVYIDLNETDVDNANGTKQNAYHLIPGQEYVKDPTVTIEAGSDSAYVRMLVTVNDYSDLLAVCKKHAGEKDKYGNPYYIDETVLLQNFTDWTEDSPWDYKAMTLNETADTATYEFRYNAATTKSEADQDLPALFNELTMPGWMDNADLQVLGAGYKATTNGDAFVVTADANETAIRIDIVAHAIQAAGFANADEAWKAFNDQNN